MAKVIQTGDATLAPRKPTPERLAALLWDSAVQAFVAVLMVQVIGSIVLGFLSSFCEDLFPTAPPVFFPQAETPWFEAPAFLKTHGLVLVFSILFVAGASRRWRILYRRKRGPLDRWLKAGARLRHQWFSLFIGNAIGAMISVFVLYSVGQFTYTRLLLAWLAPGVQPFLTKLGLAVLGTNLMNTLQALWAWYGENQLRFLFWFLYVSAVSDDLGLPNLKTLATRAWRRLGSNRLETPPGVSAAEERPPPN
jgi:hypothetical protein